ncbi:zf-HC2 domain-containing protein [bacterium]|nr:zf-HC2 domain-containing protein [bacterium]
MKCERIQKWLPLYAGRELDGFRTRAVERHLQHCPECRGVLGEYTGLRRMTRQILLTGIPVPGKTVWPGVAAGLAGGSRKAEPGGSRLRPQRFAFAFAGIAIAVVIALSLRPGPFRRTGTTILAENRRERPIVEEVQMQNVTVITLKVDDPKMHIIWFLQDET